MDIQTTKRIDVGTSVAARILSCHFTTVHKYRRIGKLKTGVRASAAPHAPWRFDREEIIRMRDELCAGTFGRLHD